MESEKRIMIKDDGYYTEIYHVKDLPFKFHNEYGPALIWCRSDGSIECEEYWINGKKLSKEDWECDYGWKLKLKGTPMGKIYCE